LTVENIKTFSHASRSHFATKLVTVVFPFVQVIPITIMSRAGLP